MSRANPVTKLGLIELARLTHEYLDNHPSECPAATTISHNVSRCRVYGHFRDLELVNKIRIRHWKRRWERRRRPLDLIARLCSWRTKRALALFKTIFPVTPAGGLSFYVRWQVTEPNLSSYSEKGGHFNHRRTEVRMTVSLHPHWQRRLGAVCLRMKRFFLDISPRLVPVAGRAPKVVMWGLEVRKSRGYTFRCAWVMFTPREIKENALDRLEPWQTDGLLGLNPPIAVPGVRGAVAAGR